MMSYNKDARAARRKRNHAKQSRQVRIYYFYNDKSEVVSDAQRGQWAKQHSTNCGRSGCFLCTNPRRRWGLLTVAEQRADLALRDEYAMQ